MASIDEVKRLLDFRAGKSGYNGTISPNEFNLLWPRAERRYFNQKYKAYKANKANSDALNPFKSDPTTITIDSAGKYTKPNNLLHIDALRTASEAEIKEVYDDRLASHLSSAYDAPTAGFPIYVEYASYLQFYPKSLASANLVYLQSFTPSKWGYTVVSGRPVYSEGTSVQPKWADSDIDEICYIALSDLGIHLNDDRLQALAERKIQTEI